MIADAPTLADLSAQSERDDVVIIEMVYLGKWVRFDVSSMEAQFLTSAELVNRYLVPALKAVSLVRTADADPSSS